MVTKIKRWNKRIKEELEGGEAGVRTPRSRPGKRERPTGKEKMMQPTLSSFLSLRSGLLGLEGKVEPKSNIYRANNKAPNRKGLELG